MTGIRTTSPSGQALASTNQTSRPPKTLILPGIALLTLVLAPLLLATTQALWLRWIAIMALAWWLPGALLVAHWRLTGSEDQPHLDLPTAGIMAAGLGLCWMLLVVLLVHWLPGPLERWLLLAAYGFGAFLLLASLFWRRRVYSDNLPSRAGVSSQQPTPASTWGWLAALLLFAALLRLPGLGYHEFHGDEAVVLRRAQQAIGGADDALALHAKGPGEIAVAMVVYRGLGTINETTARMPFALMSVGSVLAIALLGRRLFSDLPFSAGAVGFWAGVLLAANGFALGLSRIVQYQPAMLLLSVLAVLCAWEFAQRGEGRWLILVAVFSGFGFLMHYEFGILAPVLAVLFWAGWKRAPDRRRIVVMVLLAGAVVALIVAATYLPGVMNPRFAKTQRYLGSRMGDFGAFNVPIFIELGTFYNSTYFFGGLILLVVAGLVLGWRTARRRTLLLVLWFAPFLVLHLFVMQFPGTHYYLFMPSWSLLAALPLAAIWTTSSPGEVSARTPAKVMRPVARWGLLAAAVIWLAVSVGYLYLVFFRQAPEYIVNYDQEQLPVYWAPYGKNVPQRPRYSVPIQQGWKTLGTLAAWGCLEGTYASNEGSQSLRYWYMPSLHRVEFQESPDFVFKATHLQSRFRRYDESSVEDYQQVGEVRLRDEPRIEIWAREPLPVPYVTYGAEQFSSLFDGVVPPLDDWPDPPAQVRNVALGDSMTLESAGLARTKLAPGDTLHLLLVWRPQQALTTDYKVFVHVAEESGRPVAQWDGLPCLNTARTSQWVAGQAVSDHVLMTIPEDLPSGRYSVLVGLYDGASGERLGGQAVEVATITVH